jgi:hypothetical protein
MINPDPDDLGVVRDGGNVLRDPNAGRTGKALIAALQASPYRDIDIEPRRARLPVRDVKL